MITKRIVIHNYSNPINGEVYRIAINTREGTIRDSSVEVKTRMQVTALVHGYLAMYNAFEQTIEIHPGCIDTWNKIEVGV